MSGNLLKNTYRDVRSTAGRFVSVMVITALSAFIFSGLRAIAPDMRHTGEKYYEDYALADAALLCSTGAQPSDAEYLNSLPYVEKAEGAYRSDAIVDYDGKEGVYRVHTFGGLNKFRLISGRLPESADECVAGSKNLTENMRAGGETRITVTDKNSEDTLDMFTVREFKVVGIAESPLYVTKFLGATELGSGSLTNYMFVKPEAFELTDENGEPLFTAVNVRFANSPKAFDDGADDYLGELEDKVEAELKIRARARYDGIISDAEREISDAEDELAEEVSKARKELGDAYKELEDGEREIADSKAEFEDGLVKIADAEKEIADNEKKLADAKKKLDAGLKELNEQQAQLEAGKDFTPPEMYAGARAQIDAARKELNKGLADYNAGIAEIADAKIEIEEKKADTEDGREKIADAERELADGWAEYYDGERELEEKTADAEAEIADARDELADVKVPKWYILGRETNSGYSGFISDTGRIAKIADIIPAFFFLVAALVCLSAMTRMTDEQRGLIGTLKALGFSRGRIMFKYLLYAALASLLGALAGTAIGLTLFTRLIWYAYSMLYNMPALETGGALGVILFTSALSVSAVLVPTWAACSSLTGARPAVLMRPKAPKPGKRMFLEYVKPLWTRLNFSAKVTCRNLFLNKTRLVMTVVGTAGCTVLLMLGFGLRDSIADVGKAQYGHVNLQDAMLTLESPGGGELDEILGRFGAKPLYYMEKAVTPSGPAGETTPFETTVVVFAGDTEGYISFNNRAASLPRDEKLTLGEGVIVSQKLAEGLKIRPGDTLTINETRKDGEDKTASLRVDGICENYVGHHVYVSGAVYARAFGEEPEYGGVLVKYAEGFNDEDALLAAALEDENVVAALSVTVMLNNVGDMLKAMDSVVWLIILAAVLLAFVVLYNLTSINIGERVRELATLKVLGFHTREVSGYVCRETRILTLLGAAAGLFLGYFAAMYVAGAVEVDEIMFSRGVKFLSYVLSLGITLAASELVGLVMLKPLRAIDMVESLKSAE